MTFDPTTSAAPTEAATVTSYRAVQVVAPGRLVLADLPIAEPRFGEVRVRVEACGICHTDAVTVEGAMPIEYPRVPGHEAVGRIDAVGDGVAGWEVGQRVGIGFLGGHCGVCFFCRRGNFVACVDQLSTGVQVDGGYAEMLIARASGLVAIPEQLSSVEAAPLLCAGLTTFAALRSAQAKPGDLVAILGIGGLGHLAVQYARHMGFEVVAIARGEDKRTLSMELGAHHYVDSTAGDPAEALRALGGAQLVVATVTSSDAMSAVLRGLGPGGQMTVVGAGDTALSLNPVDLVFGQSTVNGRLTGSSALAEDTVKFSVLQDIRARIETVPLERAADAYARMMANDARFRIVLSM
jgi:propanol-preferring alcohol dehydrogenase